MTITMDRVYLWGRPFWEYMQMFKLSKEDLDKRILDCAGGPAAFNDDLTKLGGSIVSVDPAYEMEPAAIKGHIDEAHKVVGRILGENMQHYNMDLYNHSVDEYCQVHMASMEDFLADFPVGRSEGRYLVGALPRLPFEDRQFDLALCGNLLFAYRDVFSIDFHVRAIEELCRVAGEARVFPVTRPGSRETTDLEDIMRQLTEHGYRAERVELAYEFRKFNKEMLRVVAN